MRSRVGIALALSLILALLWGCSGGNKGGAYAPNIGGAEGQTRDSAQEARITQAVQAKLDGDANLKAAGIQAKLEAGQIELAGTVTDAALKERAEDLAFEALQNFQETAAGVLNTIVVKEN